MQTSRYLFRKGYQKVSDFLLATLSGDCRGISGLVRDIFGHPARTGLQLHSTERISLQALLPYFSREMSSLGTLLSPKFTEFRAALCNIQGPRGI